MKKLCVVAIALFVAGGMCAAVAQPEEGPGGPPQGRMRGGMHGRGPGGGPGMMPGMGMPDFGDKGAQELVEVLMVARLSKELGLDDEQTVLLVRKFKNMKEKSAAAKKEHEELLQKLERGIKSGTSDEELEAQLRAVIEHEMELVAMRAEVVKSAEGLTMTQRAKLYLFLTRFNDDMRKLAMKARERRMGMQREGGMQGMMQPQGRPDMQQRGPDQRTGMQGGEGMPPEQRERQAERMRRQRQKAMSAPPTDKP